VTTLVEKTAVMFQHIAVLYIFGPALVVVIFMVASRNRAGAVLSMPVRKHKGAKCQVLLAFTPQVRSCMLHQEKNTWL